ncbi:MAG: two-component system OmpR family response regulator [Parasphingorhabdus sp.]
MAKRVLIAEDEPHIVESLSFILQRAGFEVKTVTDGNLVMSHIKELKPDAIILDLMLPGQTGYQILKSLRANEEISQLKVLMLTAKGQDQDRQTAEQLGVDAFITKPFSNKEVVDCIRDLTSD